MLQVDGPSRRVYPGNRLEFETHNAIFSLIRKKTVDYWAESVPSHENACRPRIVAVSWYYAFSPIEDKRQNDTIRVS